MSLQWADGPLPWQVLLLQVADGEEGQSSLVKGTTCMCSLGSVWVRSWHEWRPCQARWSRHLHWHSRMRWPRRRRKSVSFTRDYRGKWAKEERSCGCDRFKHADWLFKLHRIRDISTIVASRVIRQAQAEVSVPSQLSKLSVDVCEHRALQSKIGFDRKSNHSRSRWRGIEEVHRAEAVLAWIHVGRTSEQSGFSVGWEINVNIVSIHELMIFLLLVFNCCCQGWYDTLIGFQQPCLNIFLPPHRHVGDDESQVCVFYYVSFSAFGEIVFTWYCFFNFPDIYYCPEL